MEIMTIGGLDDLLDDVKSLIDQFPEKKKRLHEEAGKKLLERVKQNIRTRTKRHTGNLEKGAYLKVGSKGGYAAVRSNYGIAPHAHLVEFGHVAENGNYVPGVHMYESALIEYRASLFALAEKFAIEIAGELK